MALFTSVFVRHELVVAGIVRNVNDPGLPGDGFGAPREAASVKTEGTAFDVATDANLVNALGADAGVGGLTAEFELALFAVVSALGTGVGALVA